MFGTFSKNDGEMSQHLNERDLIYCVSHLGGVKQVGSTFYLNDNSNQKRVERVYQVPFNHTTL